MFDNQDGALIALGATALLAAAGVARGARGSRAVSLVELYEVEGGKTHATEAQMQALVARMAGSYRGDVRAILSDANDLLDAHGVEAVEVDPEDYFSDPFALYLNTGDTYSATLAYVYPRDAWEVTTYADLAEEARRQS